MNSKNNFIVALILSAILVGCTKEHHPLIRYINNGITEDCRISDRSGHLYQIKAECAKECIGKYDRYLKRSKLDDDRELKYVAIDIKELNRVLNRPDVDITRDSTLFVMLAVMPNDRTGAVLAVRKKSLEREESKQKTGGAEEDYLYFDFTAPCPNMCPW